MLDDEEALEVLTKQLNEWWEEKEEIPDEMLRARIFLLFTANFSPQILTGSRKLWTNLCFFVTQAFSGYARHSEGGSADRSCCIHVDLS